MGTSKGLRDRGAPRPRLRLTLEPSRDYGASRALSVTDLLRQAGTMSRDITVWAREVLNLRPLACEASALPLSYAPESDNDSTP
jgi:hypothetical protein